MGRGRTEGSPKAGRTCRICGGPRSPYREIRFKNTGRLVRRVSICRPDGCGFVRIEPLPSRYRDQTSFDDLPPASIRVGTEERPGREFRMAQMAVEIVGRPDLEVLVYGAGRSVDNRHIETLDQVRNVAIADIMNIRTDAEFHDANKPASKRFSVVVASEVVEHFRLPHKAFSRLFEFVADDGLLVCGTNVYSGGLLIYDRYVFYRDHTSYYTPKALQHIAKVNGLLVDFRAPQLPGGSFGRKRYVLFAKSPTIMENASLYFGTHAIPPSE
ncbi:MAG: methyltransferase domain-containing protein [Nocardioidaceae bacterium]